MILQELRIVNVLWKAWLISVGWLPGGIGRLFGVWTPLRVQMGRWRREKGPELEAPWSTRTGCDGGPGTMFRFILFIIKRLLTVNGTGN